MNLKKFLIIVLTVFFTVVIGIVVGIFISKKSAPTTQPVISTSSPPPAAQTPNKQTSTSSVVNENAIWKTYRNEQYGFEIKYPSDWSVRENKIFSTDKRIAASGNITGNEVTFTFLSPECNFPRCEAIYPPQNLPIQIFPANSKDTTSTALSRVKGIGVSLLNIKPLVIDGETFNYFNIYESTVDNAGSNFDEPALVKNDRLYIIQCDTITGTQTIFDACNMTTEELNQLLSTFKFIN